MKRLFAFLLVIPLYATVVSDTIRDANGNLASGSIVVRPSRAFVAADGTYVQMINYSIPVTAGVVNKDLKANIGATPSGTYYNVTYRLDNSPVRQMIWTVPASGPVTIPQIESGSATAPFVGTLALANLLGASEDAVIVGAGASWGTTIMPNCPTGALRYSQTTNTFTCGTGAGTGNVSSAETSSVDGEMALFSGATGTAIKRSTITGVLRSISGVPSAVTGTATDCVKVDGSSGTCGGGGGAPTTATYITQTPDGTLSAEQALSALATGILKNTTTTGVLSIAVGADLPTGIPATSIAAGFVSDSEYGFLDGVTSSLQPQLNGKAPIGSPYITTVADGSLTGEFALASLATGILKNTTGTGIPSIAVGTDLPAHNHAGTEITSGLIPGARMAEVLAVTDLSTYATASGIGSTAIRATFTGLATNDILKWDGTDWVNSPTGPAAPGGADNATQYRVNATTFGGVINTTGTRKFLMNVSSGVPSYDTIQAGDLPLGADSSTYTASTQWVRLGSAHTLATCFLVAYLYLDNGTELVKINESNFKCHKTSFDVTVDWGVAQAGTLVLVKSGGGGGAGGGISSLGGLTGATQTFGNDTNVTVVSSGTTHTLTWAGTLAKARQNAATVYNDASTTFTAGSKQLFQASSTTSGARMGCAALPSTPVAGDMACDSAGGNILKVYDGSAWQSAAGGAVNSVFGRTGNVVAVSGDYAAISTTYNAGIKQLFQASSTTAGARIIAAALPSSPIAGDMAVDSAGGNIFKVYDGTTWQSAVAGAVSSVFGRAGAVVAVDRDYFPTQLGCDAVRTSGTVLTMFTGASSTKQCTFAIGDTPYTFTAAGTITLAGSETGTALIGVSTAGALTIWHNITDGNITAPGMTKVPGSTAFPAGAVRLYSWGITTGNWNTNPASTHRAFISSSLLPAAGTYLTSADASGVRTLDINTALVPLLASPNVFTSQAGNVGVWKDFVVAETALTDADTSQDIALVTPGARFKVCGVSVKHSAAFTGGGLTAMTVSVGRTGSATFYTSAFDIFQAVADSAFQDTALMKSGSNASESIIAQFNSTSANVSAATAGSVTISLCLVVLQ